MIKFTPETWQQILGFRVIDPDGWNRHGDFQTDWQTPLSFDQFMDKCDKSTCSRHYSDREKLRQIAANSIKPNLPNFDSKKEIRPNQPNFENLPESKLMVPSFEEMTGSD